MQTLGFDTYVEPLKLYLQKYREVSESELYYEKKQPVQWTFCLWGIGQLVSQFFDELK